MNKAGMETQDQQAQKPDWYNEVDMLSPKKSKKWTYAAFVNELRIGREYQEYVCRLLKDLGFDAYVPNNEYEDLTEEEWLKWGTAKKFVNDRDVMVVGRLEDLKLEVKSKEKEVFYSVEDYPFSDIFVMPPDNLKRMSIKPWALLTISQKTKAIIALKMNGWSEGEYGLAHTWNHKQYRKQAILTKHKHYWVNWNRFIELLREEVRHG